MASASAARTACAHYSLPREVARRRCFRWVRRVTGRAKHRGTRLHRSPRVSSTGSVTLVLHDSPSRRNQTLKRNSTAFRHGATSGDDVSQRGAAPDSPSGFTMIRQGRALSPEFGLLERGRSRSPWSERPRCTRRWTQGSRTTPGPLPGVELHRRGRGPPVWLTTRSGPGSQPPRSRDL